MNIVKVNSQNPQKRFIEMALDILRNGGVVVIPTDTIYAYACDIKSKRAIETLYRIKKMDRKKPLSFIFHDIASASEYVKNLSNSAFKIMKKALPGAYTFILNASGLVPKLVLTKQKTIGVRIPDNNIALALAENLERPLLVSSVENKDGEFVSGIEFINREHFHLIDLVLDSGDCPVELSTVVDLSGDGISILREGKGDLFFT